MKTQKPRNQHTETLAQWWNCERVTFLSHHQFPARQPCLAGPKERHLTDCWSRSKPRNQMPQLDCFWQGAHTPKKEKNQKKVTAKNSNLLLTQIIYGCRPATIKTTPRSATNADVRWKPATQLINTMWAGWTSMSRKTLCAAGWLKTLYGRALGNSQNLLYIQH